MKNEIEKIVKEEILRNLGCNYKVKLSSYDDREYKFEITGNKFVSNTFALLQSKLSKINHIADFWINAIDKRELIIYLTVTEKRGVLIDEHLHTPVLDIINHYKLS